LNSFSPSRPIFKPKSSATSNHLLHQIPAGIMSSMKYSLAGFASPLYCLWHSHKSRSRPNGISHTSSCVR
jgi:hypothetical protein